MHDNPFVYKAFSCDSSLLDFLQDLDVLIISSSSPSTLFLKITLIMVFWKKQESLRRGHVRHISLLSHVMLFPATTFTCLLQANIWKTHVFQKLGLVIWKRSLFMESKERVTDAVLDLIRRERNGETISRKLIRDVTDCYAIVVAVEVGIEEDETPDQVRSAQPEPNAKLKVYMDNFKAKFLRETENYCAYEAQDFLEHNPLTEYMEKLDGRLEDERARCDMYLHMATQEPLSKTCEKVLIEAQLELFQNEFGALLEANKDDDLARMFKDAKLYVTTILAVHNRYSSLVGNAFQNESGFIQALDKVSLRLSVEEFVASEVFSNVN